MKLWGFNWSSRKSQSSSIGVEVDFLSLCEQSVRSVEAGVANNGKLLNKRQCSDLATKLSKATLNIGELVLHCGAPAALFRPALENLYRYLNKAKLLVDKCGEKPWLAAAVFQMQNENAFRVILLEVGLCYNVIHELAKSQSKDWKDHPEDLRLSWVFRPATDNDVNEDKQDLQKRLEGLVNKHVILVDVLDLIQRKKRALKECLARYLLLKLEFTSESSARDGISQSFTSEQSQANSSFGWREILWRKETEPEKTWQYYGLLGSGAGCTGVLSAEWLDIPCAKKEFHDQEDEALLFREVGILACLKHPCIVDFFCCGIGQENGDCFIAMELMEKSLHDLIEEQKQKGGHFAIPVVVDIMVQIARGMWYLHDMGVAHRDLKPKNVVVKRLTSPHLADYFCVKLVDFGVSKINVQVNKSNTISYSGVGTTLYRAPEVHPKASLNGKGRAIWFKADVFSFAITCAHLVSLKNPFESIELSNLYNELTVKLTRPELPSDCPRELVELLKECWNSNPSSRPSFREVSIRLETCRHKLLSGFPPVDTGLDFIEKKLGEHSCVQLPLVQRPLVPIEENIAEDKAEGETSISHKNGMVKEADGEDYRSQTCQLDEHPHRAHAISTKSPKKVTHLKHGHLLTLLQSPPGRRLFGTSCNGGSKGCLCTYSTLDWCAFERWGMRPATKGPGNSISAPSPALCRSWVLTNSFQPHQKARLPLFFQRLPTPASCFRLNI